MEAYLARALDEIQRTVGGVPPAALAALACRDARKWTACEILEHLSLAFTGTAAAIGKALSSGEPRARVPRLSQRVGRAMVVDVGYFPAVKAPELTTPRGTIPADQSVVAINAALRAMDEALTAAEQRFGRRTLLANHPYFAGLTAAQWRKFHWRHTRHHMKQIRARLREGGQPL
jgi:hypothetical protein